MKKKIFIAAATLFLVNACTEDFEEMNVNPKAATQVPAETLLSSAQKEFADVLTSANVNVNVFRLYAQQWAQTTYTDESRYDLTTRGIPAYFWTYLYRDVLSDLREARRLILAGTNAPDAVRDNRLAILEVHEVYAWSVLVNIYGDIPYSEALDPDNVYPVYEDDQAIYDDLFERLDAAIAMMDTDAPGFGSSDLIYGGVGGNVESWLMFANSLKLKLAMTIVEANPSRAQMLVEEAVPNVFTSNADNAEFNYQAAPPNTNPIWVDLVQSGRQDFVIANTLVDAMQELDDPRLEQYFTTVNNEIVGGQYGTSNSFSSFSQPNQRVLAPDFEAIILSYAEVEFYLAEAAARGFDVPGTAEEHYENAIRASMEYWNVLPEEIDAYLAQSNVSWDDDDDALQQIALQKWIALYNRGYDAWTEWRRLDYPNLPVPLDAYLDAIPVRFPYPNVEQNLNTENYNAAAGAIGGDLPTTNVFWDVD